MLELQTDVFGWLQERKKNSRYGIGIHSDGNHDAVLAAIGAAGCGCFPLDYADKS